MAGSMVALKVAMLAAVLMPQLEAMEPWTDAVEAPVQPAACESGGDVAGGLCHMAMLQRQASPARKPLSISFMDDSPLSVSFVGSAVALDEDGYRKVLLLKSKHEMGNFVRRLVKDSDLQVVSEDSFRDFVGSLGDHQDVNSIRGTVEDQSRQPCGWVMKNNKASNLDGLSVPLTEDGYRAAAELRSTFEMTRFARRVIESEGLYLSGDKGNLDGLLGYYTCEKGIQSLEKMRDELRGVASSPNGWVSYMEKPSLVQMKESILKKARNGAAKLDHSKAAKKHVKHVARGVKTNKSKSSARASKEPISGIGADAKLKPKVPVSGIGTDAELNEDGYKEVAGANSFIEMSIFILRTVRSMGMKVLAEDGFNGMVPYYSGDKGTQSFEALQSELKRETKKLCAWVQGEGEETDERSDVSGQIAPLTEAGYIAVAKLRSPLDSRDYVQRVIQEMHMEVVEKGGLTGFIPYHDCEKDAKTLKEMRLEIADAAQQKTWVRALDPSEYVDKEPKSSERSADEDVDKQHESMDGADEHSLAPKDNAHEHEKAGSSMSKAPKSFERSANEDVEEQHKSNDGEDEHSLAPKDNAHEDEKAGSSMSKASSSKAAEVGKARELDPSKHESADLSNSDKLSETEDGNRTDSSNSDEMSKTKQRQQVGVDAPKVLDSPKAFNSDKLSETEDRDRTDSSNSDEMSKTKKSRKVGVDDPKVLDSPKGTSHQAESVEEHEIEVDHSSDDAGLDKNNDVDSSEAAPEAKPKDSAPSQEKEDSLVTASERTKKTKSLERSSSRDVSAQRESIDHVDVHKLVPKDNVHEDGKAAIDISKADSVKGAVAAKGEDYMLTKKLSSQIMQLKEKAKLLQGTEKKSRMKVQKVRPLGRSASIKEHEVGHLKSQTKLLNKGQSPDRLEEQPLQERGVAKPTGTEYHTVASNKEAKTGHSGKIGPAAEVLQCNSLKKHLEKEKSYPGNDVGFAMDIQSVSACSAHCQAEGVHHFTYGNADPWQGMCWCKSALEGSPVADPRVISGPSCQLNAEDISNDEAEKDDENSKDEEESEKADENSNGKAESEKDEENIEDNAKPVKASESSKGGEESENSGESSEDKEESKTADEDSQAEEESEKAEGSRDKVEAADEMLKEKASPDKQASDEDDEQEKSEEADKNKMLDEKASLHTPDVEMKDRKLETVKKAENGDADNTEEVTEKADQKHVGNHEDEDNEESKTADEDSQAEEESEKAEGSQDKVEAADEMLKEKASPDKQDSDEDDEQEKSEEADKDKMLNEKASLHTPDMEMKDRKLEGVKKAENGDANNTEEDIEKADQKLVENNEDEEIDDHPPHDIPNVIMKNNFDVKTLEGIEKAEHADEDSGEEASEKADEILDEKRTVAKKIEQSAKADDAGKDSGEKESEKTDKKLYEERELEDVKSVVSSNLDEKDSEKAEKADEDSQGEEVSEKADPNLRKSLEKNTATEDDESDREGHEVGKSATGSANKKVINSDSVDDKAFKGQREMEDRDQEKDEKSKADREREGKDESDEEVKYDEDKDEIADRENVEKAKDDEEDDEEKQAY